MWPCAFGLGVVMSVLGAGGTATGQSRFTPGDIVVSTYGNVGNAATDSGFPIGVPTPISLLEFSPAGAGDGAPLTTFTLPTTDSGNNFGIVGEYGSSSEGTIQLSTDGQCLTLGGYSAEPSCAGTGGPAGGYSDANGVKLGQSTDTSVPRVFALVDANGEVNSSTVSNNVFSTNNPRSEYLDGALLYISGQGSGSADQGLYVTTVGKNTVTHPDSGPTKIYTMNDTRITQVYDGNLYYSADSKDKAAGIFEYQGKPVNSGQTAVKIIPGDNGLSGSSQENYSPEQYYFANRTTLYVADTGNPKNGGRGDGGIQKWTLNGSTWTLDYTMKDPGFKTDTLQAHGECGFEAIAGRVVGTDAGAKVELFAVSYTLGKGDPDGLYRITDCLGGISDGGATFTEMEASGANRLFKGVAFAPQAKLVK